MSEKEKRNDILAEEAQQSVDDILAEILNSDGTFNDDFNSLLAKYIGVPQQEIAVPKVDISDRSDEEILRERAAFDSPDICSGTEKSVDERIEDKMPEDIREIYAEASSDAQRPEFTSTGDVRYPTMGIGASEQRVVFDADWEEKARQEAARLERVRRDRMLRGDSAYARTFVAGGRYMSQRNPFIDALSDDPGEAGTYGNYPYNSSPATKSLYIDPLSRDDDFETADNNSQYYNSDKKPFFPEGISVIQINNVNANGKNENARKAKNAGTHKKERTVDEDIPDPSLYKDVRTVEKNTSWLEVEDKSVKKKKKNRSGKKHKKTGKLITKIDIPENTVSAEQISEEENTVKEKVRVSPYDGNVESVADETRGLRSAVAEIVDKYNKRNEEDERRKAEEEARIARQRQLEEEERQRKIDELSRLKQDMNPEVAGAIDLDELEKDFDDYEDFSSEKEEKNDKKEKSKKRKGSLLQKFNDAAVAGADYLEKLSVEENGNEEEQKQQEKKTDKKAAQKNISAKNGNKKKKQQPKKNGGRK